jgi:hypothetical protein
MLQTPFGITSRQDGWFPHKATWAEVKIGTVLATGAPLERWEVIDMAHGDAVGYGQTLWMRVREQRTGMETTVPPRNKENRVTILTQSPDDTETVMVAEPSDTEAIMLLIRELGAVHLATRDNATGEVTCPDYVMDSHIPRDQEGWVRRGLIDHMRLAHRMDVSDELDLEESITLHGRAHSAQWPTIGKNGFPHRHIPEQLAENR